jgi:hypothetical protein
MSEIKSLIEQRHAGVGDLDGEEPKVELVTLFPMIACIYVIYRWSNQAALLYVVMPTLLLLPTYFWFTARPLPSMNFIDAALIALGAGMVLFESVRWRFSRTDIWMIAFLLSAGYRDHLTGRSTDAAFAWFAALVTALVPYMAGKLLIEQTGSRIKLCRIFVLLVGWSSFVSSTEYFFRKNLYLSFFNHFYPTQYSIWMTQIRWGFGRMAGPYSQSELAGMMIFTAWLLALWMGRYNFQELSWRKRPVLSLQHGKRWIWILFVALFMTQARGPWIGAGLAVAIAAIGRARRPVLRTVIVLSCIVLIGMPAYIFGKDYLAGPRKNYGSEKETAQYRAQLIDNYIPIAKKGEAWGWGENWPHVGGQDSIDNEYLYCWVTQGYVGAIALILLMLESVLRLLVQIRRAQTVRDRHFYLTMLAVVCGIAFTITTVFLGAQSYELLFLLVGWVQAVRTPIAKTQMIHNDEVYRASGERTLAGVYN